jgi:hypothetical protein
MTILMKLLNKQGTINILNWGRQVSVFVAEGENQYGGYLRRSIIAIRSEYGTAEEWNKTPSPY